MKSQEELSAPRDSVARGINSVSIWFLQSDIIVQTYLPTLRRINGVYFCWHLYEVAAFAFPSGWALDFDMSIPKPWFFLLFSPVVPGLLLGLGSLSLFGSNFTCQSVGLTSDSWVRLMPRNFWLTQTISIHTHTHTQISFLLWLQLKSKVCKTPETFELQMSTKVCLKWKRFQHPKCQKLLLQVTPVRCFLYPSTSWSEETFPAHVQLWDVRGVSHVWSSCFKSPQNISVGSRSRVSLRHCY